MLQDSMRSAVYRSLVHCDDPNGVIEGETIRKSKTGSRKKEQQIERLSTARGSNGSSIYEGGNDEFCSQGVKEELHSPPSFQLMEVSRGANKLNQMIDSWSRGSSFDGQSKDIAKDLLKGALDLQESLVMLCKLQEASKYMSQLKRNQKQKFEEADLGVERNDSYPFEEKVSHKRIQSGRHSVDRFERIEELKKMISESLVKQKLLCKEENASISGRKLNLAADVASTSSSQSSMFLSNDSASVGSSVSSTNQERKAKSPSLIAKLMGLEEFPSESKKIRLNERSTVFEFEMPNAKKDNLMYRNKDPERRTLQEILESVQLKGLLNSNDVDEHKRNSNRWSDSHSKRTVDDEPPPIVVIKPLRSPYEEKEGILLRQFSREEKPLHSREKFIEMGPTEVSLKKRSVQGKEGVELKTLLHDEKSLDFKKMTKEAEPKEIRTKRCINEERATISKETKRKQEVKVPKTKEMGTIANKMKVSTPLSHKPQQKERISGKHEKTPNVLSKGRKPTEENAKSSTMSRPTTTQVKVTSSNPKKLENGSVIIKNCIQRQETTSKNPTLSRSKLPISHNSNARTRNNSARKAKPVTESLPTTSVAKNLHGKDGPKKINQTGQMEFFSTLASVSRNDNLPAKDSAETEKFDIEDQGDPVCKSSLSEVSLQIGQLDNDIQFAVETEQIGDRKTERHIKASLLSNPSFLECAEDLFDLHMNQPMVHETIDVTDKLYLDYTNELIERKGYQTSVTGHPLLHTYIEYPRIKISLDQLIEEVCDGVDSLRSYTKVTDNVDGIYKVLESDVKWKGMMVGGVWDLAWANGFSVNEVDQVVCEVENYVLTGLIEEIIEDFPKSLVQDLQCL